MRMDSNEFVEYFDIRIGNTKYNNSLGKLTFFMHEKYVYMIFNPKKKSNMFLSSFS